jgi:hypothetical protein
METMGGVLLNLSCRVVLSCYGSCGCCCGGSISDPGEREQGSLEKGLLEHGG